MKYIFVLVLGAALLAFTQVSGTHYEATADNQKTSTVTTSPNGDDLTLDDHSLFIYKQLQIIPIKASENFLAQQTKIGNYLTLEEGLKNGGIVISEKDAGEEENENHYDTATQGNEDYDDTANPNNPEFSAESGPEVNSLYIQNNSTDTVFLMAGELIRGGDQDRVIAQDLLIYPNSGKIDLGVYCVEPSRWVGEGENNGEFDGYSQVASVSVRKTAILEKDQSAVWDKVAEVTEANNATTETGTYNALKESAPFNFKLNDYLSFFENKFETSDDVVGVIFANGNKIMGCEIFATPELFRKEYKNLVDSYITEVITSPVQGTVTKDEVVSYFDNVRNSYTAAPAPAEKNEMKYVEDGKVLHFTTF